MMRGTGLRVCTMISYSDAAPPPTSPSCSHSVPTFRGGVRANAAEECRTINTRWVAVMV